MRAMSWPMPMLPSGGISISRSSSSPVTVDASGTAANGTPLRTLDLGPRPIRMKGETFP